MSGVMTIIYRAYAQCTAIPAGLHRRPLVRCRSQCSRAALAIFGSHCLLLLSGLRNHADREENRCGERNRLMGLE